MTDETRTLFAAVKRGLMTALIAAFSALLVHSFDVFKVYGRVVVLETKMEEFRKVQEMNTQFRVENQNQFDDINKALAVTNKRLCRYLVERGAADPECSTALWSDYQEWERSYRTRKWNLVKKPKQ
jgi:hypothetical protein